MKINNLISRELIKRGYALEGKTRVWNIADSKLWYLTKKQSQGFLDLTKETNYRKMLTDKETGLINENIGSIKSELKNKYYNIIDLGCGDGMKGAIILKKLSNEINARYCPIDISAHMVSKAATEIKKLKLADEVVEFKWNISDFENLSNIIPLLREGNFKNNFFLLLGNTLGNFEKDDILHGIYNSMNEFDYILIGNGLNSNNENDILKQYNTKAIDNFLIEVLKQLGIKPKNVTYNVRIKNSRVELYYTLKKDVIIKTDGKSIQLLQDDIIITAISYKYNKKSLKKTLSKYFKKITIMTDHEDVYSIAFCQK